jgi:hypothetical protein
MNQLLLFLALVTLVPVLACGSPEAELQQPVAPSQVAEGPPADPVAEVLAPDPVPEEPALEPAPGAHEVVSLEHPEAFQQAPPEGPSPALDDLLRLAPVEELAPEGPQSVEWAGQREEEKREADRKKKARPKIDFSQENVTEGVPMQKERRRTDVGVSVPVGERERVRVRGGVRVDEREISEDVREAETAPTVGVEVQF